MCPRGESSPYSCATFLISGLCLRLNLTRNLFPPGFPFRNCVHVTLRWELISIFVFYATEPFLRQWKFVFWSSCLWHRYGSFGATCCILLQRWCGNILKEPLRTRLHGVTTRKNRVQNPISFWLTFPASWGTVSFLGFYLVGGDTWNIVSDPWDSGMLLAGINGISSGSVGRSACRYRFLCHRPYRSKGVLLRSVHRFNRESSFIVIDIQQREPLSWVLCSMW
jgi:hypothetical protein